MDRIFFRFRDCHGIKSFSHTFHFEKNDSLGKNTNISLVYASNGTMKTSFAKTLIDLGNNVLPKNVVTNKDPKYTIKIIKNNTNILLEDFNEINERIFVIESIKDEFKFDETAPLIADEQARQQYNEIFNELLEKKRNFLKKVKEITQISVPKGKNLESHIENIIIKDFNNSSDNLLELFLSIENDLEYNNDLNIDLIKYSTLFDEKVLKILKDKEFIENADAFSRGLTNLFKKSKIFDKDNFTHNNANDLLKNIKKNNLFKAGHKIKFKSKGQAIDNINDLDNLFKSQIMKIYDDSDLEQLFNRINSKFTNAKSKVLQEIITEDKSLIPRLSNLENLKREYWFSIFNFLIDDFRELIYEYKNKKVILAEIRDNAKNEETQWQKVIEIFNNRFIVPFKLQLDNKEDVILNQDVPEISFYYTTNDNEEKISLDILKKICSSGQLRALYLLDIIYQIEIQKTKELPTLLVFDDIADSFDYQNKYAIIEYLKDLSLDDSFRIILLTHNYDFFRTVRSRLNCENCYFAEKNEFDEIKLNKNDLEHKNLFSYFVKIINDNPETHIREFLSTIPFVRNLEEFKFNNENVKKLTNLLHYKSNSLNIKPNELSEIYDSWGIRTPSINKTIYDLIFDEADLISDENSISIDMKNKIVLSIAIRLKSEMFMFKKLEGLISEENITINQTRFLLEKYKEIFSEDIETINILEKVAMMTPENIHLNSFMFEPILDMDDVYLKKLYKEILELEND